MPDADVTAAACSLFVPLVEEGWYASDDIVVTQTVKRYLEPIVKAQCDTLILGCTHYPVLIKAISAVLGDKVSLINPGVAVAKAVADYVSKNGISNSENDEPAHSFYVSDKPDSFKNQASILLGEEIDDSKVEQVDLSSL